MDRRDLATAGSVRIPEIDPELLPVSESSVVLPESKFCNHSADCVDIASLSSCELVGEDSKLVGNVSLMRVKPFLSL